jgi:hypothetical protein
MEHGWTLWRSLFGWWFSAFTASTVEPASPEPPSYPELGGDIDPHG